MAARAQAGGMGPGREDLAQETARLMHAATQLKLGEAKPALILGRMQGSFSRLGEYALVLARLQQTLVLQALPITIIAPDGLKVAEKDTPESYLRRAMQSGREQSDWLLVSRALDAYQALNLEVAPGNVQADRSSYQQFLMGLNQEQAEEWSAAVRAYQSALRSAGPNLPAEEIGRRLRAIKEAHPKEYEAAGRSAEFGGAGPDSEAGSGGVSRRPSGGANQGNRPTVAPTQVGSEKSKQGAGAQSAEVKK